MKVTEAFNRGAPTLSFEFFPPKTPEQEKQLFEVIGKLKIFQPDFVSVTYGALGATREKTFHWAREIKEKFQIEPVAHLTCVAATKDDIAAQLDLLEKIGIENILALRGDPPEGEKDFVPPQDGFLYAKELIAFIKKDRPNICLGAAAFPEAPERIQYLKEKVTAGAQFAISQMFFDNRHYFNLVNQTAAAGITIPIIPGLMPITSLKQIQRLTGLCCATIPPELSAQLEKHQSDPAAVQKIGAEHTAAQAQALLKAGVKGLHFFVMNQAEPISRILKRLREDQLKQ